LLATVFRSGQSASQERFKDDADLCEEKLPISALLQLGTTRFRFGDSPMTAALSADGKTLAILGDLELTLIDMSSGKRCQRVPHAQGAFTGSPFVAFLEEPGRLVFVCSDVAQVFDMARARVTAQLRLPSSNQVGTRFALCKKAHRLAMACGESLHILDLKTGAPTTTLRLAGVDSPHVCMSEDGKWVAAWDGRRAKPIEIWNLLTKKKACHLENERVVTSVAFTSRGALLAVGELGPRISLWSVPRGEKVAEARTVCPAPLVGFYPDEARLCVQGRDGSLELWNCTARPQKLFAKPGGSIRLAQPLIAFDANDGGRECIIEERAVQVRAIPGGTLLSPRGFHEDVITALCFLPGGKLLSGSKDGRLCTWDLRDGKMVSHLTLPAVTALMERSSLAISEDAQLAATGSRIFDTTSARSVMTFRADPLCSRVELAPPFAVCADRSQVRAWQIGSGEKLWHLEAKCSEVSATAISPRSKLLAVASNDVALGPSRVQVYDLLTGSVKLRLHAHAFVPALAFSTAAEHLAVGTERAVRFYNTTTGELLQTIELPCKGINSLAFSPDDRLIAVGMLPEPSSGSIGVLELCSGQMRCEFVGHKGGVSRLVFSADGRSLASAGTDTSILIWNVRAAGRQPDGESRVDAQLTWRHLSSSDAKKAHQAIVDLVRCPQDALALFRTRLPTGKRHAVNGSKLDTLILQLNNKDFRARQNAMQELERFGPAIVPKLRRADQQTTSLELSRRIQLLLQKIKASERSSENLRRRRAIEVLELINSAAARDMLRDQASAFPEDSVTQDAIKSLRRFRAER
jgi:WD40 repeat protein